MELSAVSANGTTILYEENFWSGKKYLSINGVPAVKIAKKRFRFTDADGKETFYTVQGNFFSGVTVSTDSMEHTVLAKNKWYDWLIIALSLVGITPAIILCGALGAGLSTLFCGLAALFNISLSRSKMNVVMRFLGQLIVIAAANLVWFLLWFFLAALILGAQQNAAAFVLLL